MPDESDVNSLLRDFIRLVPISDATISYWASEALNQLTQLRSLAAQRGLVHWSLTNTQLLRTDLALMPVLNSTLNALGKLATLLKEESTRAEIDSQTTGAASRIYNAVQVAETGSAVHPVEG